MTFDVNRDLFGAISNDEDTLYDRYTVKYETSFGDTEVRTGTIPDLLSYVLPSDTILEVVRNEA